MIVKIGKRPGRIHCKKRCDISVFNGTMAYGACLSRSLAHLSGGCNIQEAHELALIALTLNSLPSGIFFHDFLSSADFFQNQLFRKIISGIPPESGFPQALEIMENLENHQKKVPWMEKSWNLKKSE